MLISLTFSVIRTKTIEIRKTNRVWKSPIKSHFTIRMCILVICKWDIFEWFSNPVPGLQSILDLLIIDIVRVQMFNYVFFMCFLFIGIFHGQLPFLTSQLIVFILQNSDVYVSGLFQCFLVIKAVLIFRGSWMAEVTDSWILRLYR